MTINFTSATGGPVPKIEGEISLSTIGGLPDGTSYRDIYVIAEKVAAGTGTVDTAYQCYSAADATTYGGAGSNAESLAHYIFNNMEPTVGKPKCRVFMVPETEAGAGTKAVQTLVLATNATGSGYWIFDIGGHQFTVNVSSGDTITTQGDNVVAAWAALPVYAKVPITPVNVAGTITWTANNKCEAINNIGLSTIHSATAACATTATWSNALMGTAGGGGTAGAGLMTLTTAMANLLTTRTPVIIGSMAPALAALTAEVANWEVIVEHLNTKGGASSMLGGTLIAAAVDAAADLITLEGTNDDDPNQRFALVGINGVAAWPCEIAAKYAAVQAAEQSIARSLNGLEIDILPPASTSVFSEAQCKALLEVGITPLWVPPGDTKVRIVRAVSMNHAYGVMDWCTMTVADYVRDAIAARLVAKFPRASIVADTAEAPPIAYVTQPKAIKAEVYNVLKLCEDAGMITAVDTDFASFIGELNGSTYGMEFPVTVVKQLHNIMFKLDVAV